ncbi:COG4705 family protein [Microbacterium xylanilyticum]
MTAPRRQKDAQRGAEATLAPTRVPDPTPGFWIAKAASTAFGEAASDFSIHVAPPVVAVLTGFALFAAALVWQLTRRRYVPSVYWFAVAMVGVFGTMAADVVHVVLGLPYAVTTLAYALSLGLVFLLWWRTERSLSVHEVRTTRRELFYWAAVVATFALGTAAGDLAAVGLHLGYVPSIALFAVLIMIPALGFRFLGWNGVLTFWTAYVLTRPLGASVADWLGKPVTEGGVGIGSGWIALFFAVAMTVAVSAFARARRPRASAAARQASPR